MRDGQHQIIDDAPMLEIHDLVLLLLLAPIPTVIALYVDIEAIDEGKLEIEFLCLGQGYLIAELVIFGKL